MGTARGGGRQDIAHVRTCHPVEFARLIAGTLPKEFVVDSTLSDIGDDELVASVLKRGICNDEGICK
jgi:hypothetical protein